MPSSITRVFLKTLSSRYLLMTNTLVTSVLLGVADAIQQRIHGDWNPSAGKPFNQNRTWRFSGMGFVMGPMNHAWYKCLDRIAFKGSRQIVVLKKVFLDTLTSPAFASTFIAGVALMEGKSVAGALDEYKRKFLRIMKLDLCVWPPTQTLNFFFLPPSCRVIYVASVQLIYNCFLSYIKHNEADGTKTSSIE